MSKRHKKARTVGKPVPQIDPVSSIVNQGKIAFGRNDYDRAITAWETSRKKTPITPELKDKLNRSLAEAYFRRGLHALFEIPTQAISDFTQAASLQPSDALYVYHLGSAYHRQNDLANAITNYREALQRDPGFKRAYYPLALALVQQGQAVTKDPVWPTLDMVQRARLTQIPTDDPVSKGLALAAQNDWSGAQAQFTTEAVKSEPPKVQGLANYYLGVIAAQNNDPVKAREYWIKAFDTGLQMPALQHNLALADVLQVKSDLDQGRLENIPAITAKGLTLDPKNKLLSEVDIQARLALGFAAAEKGDWQTAIVTWEKVPPLSGPNARALAVNLAIAHEKTEDWEAAAEAWREFIRRRSPKVGSETWLSPEQVARIWSRVSGLYVRADLPQEAVKTLQTALKYQPDDPALMLALANCYLDNDQTDAAYNQIDRVIAKAPGHIEALVLKAELSEEVRRSGFYNIGTMPGIREWTAVLKTNDEIYAPVARERLGELYPELVWAMMERTQWGGIGAAFANAEKAALEGLELLPDAHFLRAVYVEALLDGQKPKEAEARRQTDLVDLTDLKALHHLIDVWQKAKHPEFCAELLQKADARKPLTPDFYLGVASCALGRKQNAIAENYFAEAMNRSTDPKLTQGLIGLTYAEHGMEAKAETIWQEILKQDRSFGPVHMLMAQLWTIRHDLKRAKEHYRQAERWGKANNNQPMVEEAHFKRTMLDTPFGGMLGGTLPDLDLLDDLDLDDMELDDFDPFTDQPNYVPQTDSRRRRMEKSNKKR